MGSDWRCVSRYDFQAIAAKVRDYRLAGAAMTAVSDISPGPFGDTSPRRDLRRDLTGLACIGRKNRG